jgi:hypothetical protein
LNDGVARHGFELNPTAIAEKSVTNGVAEYLLSKANTWYVLEV